jgi:hypothetical protein
MPDQGALGALRASIFALVCVLLGAAGHAAASGALPPLLGLVTGLPLIALLTCALVGRQRSRTVIVAALTGAQLGLHALFDYAAAIPTLAGHHAHGSTGSITPAVAAAHIAAGLLAGWWLRRGEAALWAHCATIAAAAAPLLGSLRRVASAEPLALPGPALLPLFRAPTALHSALLRHSVRRRGPPLAPSAH